METELILNELSLLPPAPRREEARLRMEGLVRVLIALHKVRGVVRGLRVPTAFLSTEVSPGYPLRAWHNDPQVDKETARYLFSLASRAPAVGEDPLLSERRQLVEAKYQGRDAVGLLVTHLLCGICVSVPGSAEWDRAWIPILVTSLESSPELEEDEEQPRQARHASSPAHAEEHAGWVETRLASGIASGAAMWTRRGELFPSLRFCPRVEGDLAQLGRGNPLVSSVLHRLQELQEFCDAWVSGPFSPDRLPSRASPESAATLQQYGHDRTWLCADGSERLFSWHVRLTPHDWRLYFHETDQPGQLYIGYVGPHLRTARFPG